MGGMRMCKIRQIERRPGTLGPVLTRQKHCTCDAFMNNALSHICLAYYATYSHFWQSVRQRKTHCPPSASASITGGRSVTSAAPEEGERSA